MPKRTTNQTDISYVVQSQVGQVPATPAFQILPTVSGSPSADISTEISAIIRSDRMTDDLVPVDADVGGDIEYEVAYAPFKPLLIQLLRNTLSAVINHSGTVTTSNASSTITDSGATFVTDGIVVGQFIKLAGSFVDSTLSRIYTVTALTETELTVLPAPASDETDITATISSSGFVRNGADAPTLNTICKRVLGDTPSYFYYIDSIVNSMTMNFETGSILAGTMNLMGTTENATETAEAGQTFVDPPEYAIMNSVDNIVEIGIEGLPATTCFQTMDLTINNQAEAAKCIGTLGASENQDFSWDIMANMEVYFEDLTLYNKFKNSESFGVYIILRDSLGNEMVVSMPVCKFEELDVPIGGKDQFLTMPGSFRALRDQDENYMVQIDFFDAA